METTTAPRKRRTAPKLPFAPIEKIAGKIDPTTGEIMLRDLARRIGRDPATIKRWRQNGVSVDEADDLATRFYAAPAPAVWGQTYWDVVGYDACDAIAADDDYSDLIPSAVAVAALAPRRFIP